MKLFVSTKIQVASSPVHGLGVFATQDIENGELIEECPFLELPLSHGEVSSLLIDYRFNFPSGDMTVETKQVVTFGYGSLYNHHDDSNAYWFSDNDKRTFLFYACKPIKAGEEIFVYYGGNEYWNDGRNNITIK
jgi:uncharacterized protein